jgi:hypothetical protein
MVVYWTHWYSSLAPELSHCPQVILCGIDWHTQHSRVRLTETEVLVQVSDTPRNILSSNLL